MLIDLPEEIIILIVTYLNFRNEDMINCRLFNKYFKSIIEKPITTMGYPGLSLTSFWYFSIDYLLFRNSIRRQVKEANDEFDEQYMNMLIDKGWI